MFTNMYELATKYYEYHGNLAIPQRFLTLNGYEYNKDGIALGRWLVNQRQFYKRNELADERIKLLENIGIEWNGKNINKWNEILALARNYLNYFVDLKMVMNMMKMDTICING